MLCRRIDGAATPLDALAALDEEPGAFLLESRLSSGFSGVATPGGGRFSFAGAWPGEVIEETADAARDPLAAVEAAIARARAGRTAADLRARRADLPVPFAGGAVGFLAYDFGRRLERLPSRAARDQRFPDVRFGIYAHVLACDHETGAWFVAGLAEGFEGAFERYRSALARQICLGGKSEGGSRATGPQICLAGKSAGAPRPARRTFTREAYCAAVARAIEYIRDGDIFEVNLSQRFEADVEASPLGLYARLRDEAPAPFAGYVKLAPDRAVLSASPERFLAVRGSRAVTEPIKGTRPRGADEAADRRLADELLRSAKDRAELAMIVDLSRNDLGRVAAAGTVRVRQAAELRSFPTVHHLAGVVEAELAPGRGALDAVRAAFPPGSITGAPKVRAMEIIEELEPTRRSVYTGAIGYLGLDGDADLNVAIRTILLDGRRATFQAGGAVTAESDPGAEHEETLAKARALARACGVTVDHDA